MELLMRAAADLAVPHLIIPQNKNTTTRTETKSVLRMKKTRETMVMPQLQRRPQLPTTTVAERNKEQECTRGRPSDVLRLLDSLQLPVDEDTYAALIKECIDSRDAVQGSRIHAHIQRRTRTSTRNSSHHVILADRLLLMYAACGRLRDARQLFDEMPVKDAISRVTMIAALADRGDHVEAIKLFVDMHGNGCAGGGARFFDAVVAVLGSCVRAEDLQLGQQVHGLTLKLVGEAACADSLVARLLVRLYSGCQDWAEKLVGWMRPSDTAAWTSVINGYCKKGQLDRALLAFREMRKLVGNRKKNSCRHIHSFQSIILRARATVGDEGWSRMQAHADAIKTGLDKDPTVGSDLVRMYGKYGREDGIQCDQQQPQRRSVLEYHACQHPRAPMMLLWEMKAAGKELREFLCSTRPISA